MGDKRAPAEAQRKRVRWEESEQRNERVFAPLGGNEGYGACDDEEQEKALALLYARAVTSARSAGGFGDLKLALFRPVGFEIGAVLVKKRLNPRRCGISGGADEKRRRFWR